MRRQTTGPGRLLLVGMAFGASVVAVGCSDSDRPVPAVSIDETEGGPG